MALILLASTACGRPLLPPGTNDGPNDLPPEVQPCQSADEALSGPFEKPKVDQDSSRRFRHQVHSQGRDLFTKVQMWTRPYMPEPEGGNTVWMDHGEHFALDAAFSLGGSKAPDELGFRMLAFVDFEPVPFEMVRVNEPGGWPLRKRFPDLNFERHEQAFLRAGRPLNVSIVIPPESLGARGVHDIRIVILFEHRPDSDEPFLQFQSPLSNQGYTLFYGGNEVVNPVDKPFPSLERTSLSGGFHFHLDSKFGGAFLYPQVYKSRYSDRNLRLGEMRLGEVYTQTRADFGLEATVRKSTSYQSAGTNYYVVLKDMEPIPGLAGLGQTDGPENANRLPIPIELEGRQPHSVRVLSFPSPHCYWLDTRKPPLGRVSNTLFVQHAE